MTNACTMSWALVPASPAWFWSPPLSYPAASAWLLCSAVDSRRFYSPSRKIVDSSRAPICTEAKSIYWYVFLLINSCHTIYFADAELLTSLNPFSFSSFKVLDLYRKF
jgi:hypothetical protein